VSAKTFPSTAIGAASLSGGVWPGVLYVDDDEAIRSIYGEILLQAGYRVDLAADGEAGWEALQRKKYKLLITDHDMPQLTGLELAARVRDAGMTLPIVIASGCVSFAGNDAYAWLRLSPTLQKPFTPDDLLQTVKAVLLCAAPLADPSQSRHPLGEGGTLAS
jgi:DNA-binding response OmpR family regulator